MLELLVLAYLLASRDTFLIRVFILNSIISKVSLQVCIHFLYAFVATAFFFLSIFHVTCFTLGITLTCVSDCFANMQAFILGHSFVSRAMRFLQEGS